MITDKPLDRQIVSEAYLRYKSEYGQCIPGFVEVSEYIDTRKLPTSDMKKYIRELGQQTQSDTYNNYSYIMQTIGLILDPNIDEYLVNTILRNPNRQIKITNSKTPISIMDIVLSSIETRTDSSDIAKYLIDIAISLKLNNLQLVKLCNYAIQSLTLKETLKYKKFKVLFESNQNNHALAFIILSSNANIKSLVQDNEKEVLNFLYSNLKSHYLIDRINNLGNQVGEPMEPDKLWFWKGLAYVINGKEESKYLFQDNTEHQIIKVTDIIRVLEIIKNFNIKVYSYLQLNKSYSNNETHAIRSSIYCLENKQKNGEYKLAKQEILEMARIDFNENRIKTLAVWTELFGVPGILAYLKNKNSNKRTWLECMKQICSTPEYIKWHSNDEKTHFCKAMHALLLIDTPDKYVFPDIHYSQKQLQTVSINNIIYELQKDIQPTIELSLYNASLSTTAKYQDIDSSLKLPELF